MYTLLSCLGLFFFPAVVSHVDNVLTYAVNVHKTPDKPLGNRCIYTYTQDQRSGFSAAQMFT